MAGSNNNIASFLESVLNDSFRVDIELAKVGIGGEQFDIIIMWYFKAQFIKNDFFQGLNSFVDLYWNKLDLSILAEHWFDGESDSFLNVFRRSINECLSSFQLNSDNVNKFLWIFLFTFLFFFLLVSFLFFHFFCYFLFVLFIQGVYIVIQSFSWE